MKLKNSVNLAVKPISYIIVAISILLVPLRMIFAFFLCVTIHELGHYLALKFFGIKINAITITASGIIMDTAPMSKCTEFITAAAGPVFGLIPLIFYKQMPIVAFFACLQTIYNLLPIYPHDGARMLSCICSCFRGGVFIQHLMHYIGWITLAVLAICVCYLLNFGVIPIILIFAVFIKNISRNIPCNHI